MSFKTNLTKTVRSLHDLIKERSDQSHKQTIEELILVLEKVKNWNDELLHVFLDLVDQHHRTCEEGASSSTSSQEDYFEKIKSILDKLFKVDDETTGKKSHLERLEKLSPLEKRIVPNPNNPIVNSLRVSYDLLKDPTLKICLLFLAIFPEKAILKKKLVLYWWVSEGLVRDVPEGNRKLSELEKHEFIRPYRIGNCPECTKFQIHPWIRYMLIAVAIEQKLLKLNSKDKPCFDPTHSLRACLISKSTYFDKDQEFINLEEHSDLRTIYNVSGVSLKVKRENLLSLKKLVVLQLGSWQAYFPPEEYVIRITGDQSFLNDLKTLKNLKYLSLRGISRITRLPDSITELVSLEILDLKACHNLEVLPDDVSPLLKLTILDLSECFMLQNMPQGLDKLTSLQVLKGFIIDNSQKRTPARIENLEKLEKLELLGIYIARGYYLPNFLEKLKDFAKKVKILKISWCGAVTEEKDHNELLSTTDNNKENQGQRRNLPLTFPPNLEELKLEGIPSSLKTKDWFKHSNLKNLKKLYIKGGKIESLDHNDDDKATKNEWKVEILLLKYTDNLQIKENDARNMFSGRLKYAKKVKLSKDLVETTEFEWPLPERSSSSSSK